jgi:hypothetical protein
MITRTIILRAFFSILLAVTIHPTHLYAQTQAENIDKMLELSGLKKQVEQMPEQIRSGFVQRQQRAEKKLSPEDYDRLLKIITDSYNASDLKQSVADYFKKHYDHDRVSAELKILNLPLSRKMAELEDKASTPEALQEIQKYAEKLKSEPAAPERLELVRRLDKAASATDLQVDLLVTMIMSNVRMSSSVGSTEKRLDQNQLKLMADRIRKELWSSMENFTTTSFLYVYRGVPDAEMKEYIKLHENDTTDWFKPIVKGALINALTVAGEKADKQAAKMLPKSST